LLARSRGCNSNTIYQYRCEKEAENGGFIDTLRRDNTAQLVVTDTIRDNEEEIPPAFVYPVRDRKPVYYISDDFLRGGTRHISRSEGRGTSYTLTDFYIPVDTEKAIRERSGITWFEEHRREKSEAIINGIAFYCSNRQVVRSSQFFACRAECLRLLQELSAVQTKIGGPIHPNHRRSLGGQR